MSASKGAPSGRPDSSKARARRPSLDRPSLFAGMEGDVTDIEPERIRILSSLEPRPAVAPRRRKSSRAATSRWWSHVLLGLMGMGLFTVALAAFLIIRSSAEPDLSVGGQWPPPDSALINPDATLAANPPAAGALSAEVAEAETFGLLHASAPEAATDASGWQDVVPTDRAGSSVAPDDAAGSARIETLEATAPSVADSAPTPLPKAASPGATTQTPSPASSSAGLTSPAKTASSSGPNTATAAARSTAPQAATARPTQRPSSTANASNLTPAERQTASASSADVSLLEAVFPKHDPRTASKADLFKACQGMSGAESAICRARICVQHPGVPACQ